MRWWYWLILWCVVSPFVGILVGKMIALQNQSRRCSESEALREILSHR